MACPICDLFRRINFYEVADFEAVDYHRWVEAQSAATAVLEAQFAAAVAAVEVKKSKRFSEAFAEKLRRRAPTMQDQISFNHWLGEVPPEKKIGWIPHFNHDSMQAIVTGEPDHTLLCGPFILPISKG